MASSRDIEAVLKIRDELSATLKTANNSLKQLNKEVKTVQQETQKVGKNTSFVNLAKGIAGAQVAIRAATVFFREFTVGAVAAQSAQEDAINKLNLALANQGNLLPGTSQRLQEYAASLQQITTFGDEVILQAQGLLASFGMNEAQLKSTTAVALDFAAATGRDLTMAVNLLGKAFVGETGELSRYGIVIDKNIPKHERFAEVMRQLQERFGGAAQAEVATFSGRMKQFQNAVGDAQEGLGFFIGQLLDFGSASGVGISVIERIGKVFREDFVLALGLARKAFTSWVSFFLGLWESLFRRLGQMAGPFGKTLLDMADSIDNFRVGLKTAGDEMLAEAAIAANAGVQTLEFANATNAVTTSTNEAGGSVKEFNSRLDELGKTAAEQAKNMSKFREEADKIANEAWEEHVRRQAEEVQKLTKSDEELADAMAGLLPSFSSVVGKTTEAAKVTVSLNEVIGAGVLVMGDIGNVLSIFGVEVDSTIGKITRLISSFESLFDNVNSLIGLFTGGGGIGGGGGLISMLGGLFGGGGGGEMAGIGSSGLLAAGTPGTLSALEGAGSTAGAGFLSGFGSTVGGGLSSLAGTLAPLFTNPFTAIIGGGIAGFFVFKKLFGGPSTFESIGTEAARDFGMTFSEELQWHIVNLAEDVFGGDRATAMQAALADIIREGLGDGFDASELEFYTQKIADTFSFIERGQLSATEGQQILNDAFAQLIPHLDELGAAGRDELERILAASQRLGIEFDGQEEAVKALLKIYEDLGIKVPPWVQEIADGFGLVSEELDGATDATSGLGDEIRKLPKDVHINITEHLNKATGGGGGGGGNRINAQGGLHIPMVTAPEIGPIYAHRGESVDIDKPGRQPGGVFELHVIHETPDGKVLKREVLKMVNDGIATGRIQL